MRKVPCAAGRHPKQRSDNTLAHSSGPLKCIQTAYVSANVALGTVHWRNLDHSLATCGAQVALKRINTTECMRIKTLRSRQQKGIHDIYLHLEINPLITNFVIAGRICYPENCNFDAYFYFFCKIYTHFCYKF